MWVCVGVCVGGCVGALVQVRKRFTSTVKMLLDFGADVNATTQFLETPLHVAAQQVCLTSITLSGVENGFGFRMLAPCGLGGG